MAMEVHQGRGDKGSVLFDLTCVHEEQWNADEGSKWTHDVLLGGFDCTAKLVHLFPGAHTNLGGVKINEKCETDIEGLYAAGEVSAGIHGASRLAGNALSECLVFGARAGKYAALHAKFVEMHPFSREQVSQSKEEIGDFLTRPPSAGAHPEDVKKMVKQLMWTKAGLLRNESNLKAAVDELDKIRREVLPKLFARTVRDLRDAFEVLNMVTVSEMIVRSALIRTETRGTHYRLDFPQIDDKNWLRNTTLKMTNKTMALASTSPVITRLYPQQDGE
jgi:succinate dehydrogenase/fumarate reductase flavoprotein subunit